MKKRFLDRSIATGDRFAEKFESLTAANQPLVLAGGPAAFGKHKFIMPLMRAAALFFLLSLNGQSQPNPASACAPPVFCFADGKWQKDGWLPIQRPDIYLFTGWDQKNDCIELQVPVNLAEQEKTVKALLPKDQVFGPQAGLLCKTKQEGDIKIVTDLSFEKDGVPAIALVREYKAGLPLKFCRHIEVDVWKNGIVVWQCDNTQGAPIWTKLGFLRFSITPGEKVRLEIVKSKKKASAKVKSSTQLEIKTAEHEMGLAIDFPEGEFFLALSGCYGKCRYYNLTISKP